MKLQVCLGVAFIVISLVWQRVKNLEKKDGAFLRMCLSKWMELKE